MWCIRITDYYSALKRRRSCHLRPWMDLEDTVKDKQYMVSHVEPKIVKLTEAELEWWLPGVGG